MLSNTTVACDAPRAAEQSTVVFAASRRAIFADVARRVPRVAERTSRCRVINKVTGVRHDICTAFNILYVSHRLFPTVQGFCDGVVKNVHEFSQETFR